MRLEDFDYELPRELIARHPADRRDDARLMVLHRETKQVEHRCFREIGDYLQPDDVVYLMAVFPIKIKWLILIFAGFTFLNTIGPQTGYISHVTHLGGLIAAFIYLKGWKRFPKHPHYRKPDATYHSRRSQSIFDNDDKRWWR